jgi:hypothetical protein
MALLYRVQLDVTTDSIQSYPWTHVTALGHRRRQYRGLTDTLLQLDEH